MSILMDIGRLLSGVVIVDGDELAEDIGGVLGPICLVFLIFLAIACIAASFNKKKTETFQNSKDGEILAKTETVLVVKKETDEENGMYLPINTILFEMNDGRRLRLRINDEMVFRGIVEGERGELRYQGTRFISFNKICDFN